MSDDQPEQAAGHNDANGAGGASSDQDKAVAELRAASLKLAATVAGTDAHWWSRAVSDPDRRKYLDRLYDAVTDITRLVRTKQVDDEGMLRTLDLLRELDTRLKAPDTESIWALLYEFQLLLVQYGDERVICGMIESELFWHQGQTTWLTWDALYPHQPKCAAVEQYRSGIAVSLNDLQSARHMLSSLYRSRRDDQLAHHSRAQARSQNLLILAGILTIFIPLFLVTYWYASHPRPSVWGTVMLPIAGAVGAALSGTLKARDQLNREADIGRFKDGLLAQLLVGAAAAVIVVVLLKANLTSVGNITPNTITAQAAFGFLAGFSEPFLLGVVGRAANLGSTAAAPGTATGIATAAKP